MSDVAYAGQQSLTDRVGDFNRHSFLIKQTLLRTRTMTLVRVLAVYGGGVAAPPTVDVLPLVNQMDGAGNSVPHGTVLGVLVFRPQSALGAVILDPVVGDVGFMAVADRDLSTVKANAGAQSNPGSRRVFSLADGVYVGGLFGGVPTQYVEFTALGINIVSLGALALTSATLTWNGTPIAVP
jgi:hypothetical protein